MPKAFPMNQEACLHLFCTNPRRSAIKPAYRPRLASAQRSAKEPPASNTHVEAADTKHAPRYPRQWLRARRTLAVFFSQALNCERNVCRIHLQGWTLQTLTITVKQSGYMKPVVKSISRARIARCISERSHTGQFFFAAYEREQTWQVCW